MAGNFAGLMLLVGGCAFNMTDTFTPASQPPADSPAQAWHVLDLIAAAQFLLMAGADDMVADTPLLLEALTADEAKPVTSSVTTDKSETASQTPLGSSPSLPSRSLEERLLEAQTLAHAAQDLPSLYQALAGWDGCGLAKTAGHLIFNQTMARDEKTSLMVIAEAPTASEDISGNVFQGDQGALLNAMLHAISIERNSIYGAYLSFWRPPGQRSLTREELALCRPFLERQIELVAPSVLLLLGQKVCQEILPASAAKSGMKAFGVWHQLELSHASKSTATFYPALGFYDLETLLKTPPVKKQAWHYLLTLQEKLLIQHD